MLKWSVLNDSISEFMADINRPATDFLHFEIDSVLIQLNKADTQESLYQLASVHRKWGSPLSNRIFFSGLNQLRDKFGDFYIDMLITEFSPSAYIPQRNFPRREIDYAQLVRDGAEDIFPEFTEFRREAVFENFRVDLLAKMPTGQAVIFELKTGAKNPTPQLIRYSQYFHNPILIGITEKALRPCEECDRVYYFTYDMLNCRAASNIRRQFSTRSFPNDSSSRFDSDFQPKIG